MERHQGGTGHIPVKRLGLSIALSVATAVFLLIVGCGQKQPAATPSPAPEPAATATRAPAATPIPTPIAALPGALPEELFLEILSPANESELREMPLVVGRTTPDAVVSVDGQTVDVNAQGEFTAQVSLEPGPNVVEVIASDLAGQQKSRLLAIIFIP